MKSSVYIILGICFLVDREKEKQRLQDIFYGLDRIPEEEIKHPSETPRKHQLFEDSEKDFECQRMNECKEERFRIFVVYFYFYLIAYFLFFLNCGTKTAT